MPYSYICPTPWFILTECMRCAGLIYCLHYSTSAVCMQTRPCSLDYVTWLFLLGESKYLCYKTCV